MTVPITAMLSLAIADKTFPAVDGGAPLALFRDFRLEIAAGRVTGLIGPSGCGKSTLLSLIAGMDRDFSGQIRWAAGQSPRIGFVFQTPRLLPWRTVAQNLALVMAGPAESLIPQIHALLDAVGIADFADSYPARLSLGMARRVAIARAFAVDPQLLLLDEPFVSLDRPTAERLRALTRRMLSGQQKDGRPVTATLVTHDPVEAAELADDLVLLTRPPGTRISDRLSNPLTAAERNDPQAVREFATALARMIGSTEQAGPFDNNPDGTEGDGP